MLTLIYIFKVICYKLQMARHCDDSGENLLKTGWMVSEIFNMFSVFPGDTFSNCKMETKLCDKFHYCHTLFIELKYLDHNPQLILELVEQFLTRLTICVYVFSTPPGKDGRKQNFGKKDKLVSSVPTRLRIHWNFVTIYARSVGPTIKKEEEKENQIGGRKRRLGIIRQNRMAGNDYYFFNYYYFF